MKNKKEYFYLSMFIIGSIITIYQLYKTIPIVLYSITKKYILPNPWYVDTFIIIVDFVAMILGTMIYPYANYKLAKNNKDLITIIKSKYNIVDK